MYFLGGSFLHQEQIQSSAWQQVMEAEVGNVKHKLYGGAQYNRWGAVLVHQYELT